MIETFTGRLGGGKSYAATKRIADHVCQGHHVRTNIVIDREAMAKYVERHSDLVFDPEQIVTLEEEQIPEFNAHCPLGSPDSQLLIVIDEADVWLNSRDWNKQGADKEKARKMFHYLKQSRKLYTDIIFIVQHEHNLDAQIGRMIQYIWRFRDMSKLYIPGLGIKWPTNHFKWNQYDYDGKTLLRQFLVSRDKEIFPLYQTTALLSAVETLASGVRRNLKKKPKKKLPKMLKYAILLLMLAIPVSLWHLYQTFQKPEVKAMIGKVPQGQAAMAASSPPPAHVDLASIPAPLPLRHKKVESRPEHFRGFSGTTLRTDAATYTAGEPCADGIVRRVTASMATIIPWDPEDPQVIVVAVDDRTETGRRVADHQAPNSPALLAVNERLQGTAGNLDMTHPLGLPAVTPTPYPTATPQQHLRQPAWMDHLDAPATGSATPGVRTGLQPVGGHF